MDMQTSPLSKEKKKLIRSLASRKIRQRRGLCLVEGPRVIGEAQRAGLLQFAVLHPKLAVASAYSLEGVPDLEGPVFSAAGNFFDEVTDVHQSQGLLGVARLPPPVDLEAMAETGGQGVLLFLDAVQDPGNVGALIRSAWALGTRGVLIGPGTADPFGPKAVRASAGGVFHLPIHQGFDASEGAAFIAQGFAIYIARAGGPSFKGMGFGPKAILAVGNEARGFSEWIEDAGEPVSVPMVDGADSLNVVVAGSIILEGMIGRL